jgi:hypothetical protein
MTLARRTSHDPIVQPTTMVSIPSSQTIIVPSKPPLLWQVVAIIMGGRLSAATHSARRFPRGR